MATHLNPYNVSPPKFTMASLLNLRMKAVFVIFYLFKILWSALQQTLLFCVPVTEHLMTRCNSNVGDRT